MLFLVVKLFFGRILQKMKALNQAKKPKKMSCAKVPPKISISDYMGIVKGRTAIRVFNRFRNLKKKPYWGNHF